MRRFALLIFTTLLAPSLALANTKVRNDFEGREVLTDIQKKIILWELESRVVRCIGRTVARDPRYLSGAPGDLSTLVVDSLTSRCGPPVLDVRDSYDQFYGEGGEAYVMGPHLEYLSKTLPEWLQKNNGSGF